MHSIYDYIDAAKAKSGISTDAELSRALGLSTPQVGFWKKKKSMPSCESMIKLAEMGEMDPNKALIELGFWGAASRDEVTAAQHFKNMIDQFFPQAA